MAQGGGTEGQGQCGVTLSSELFKKVFPEMLFRAKMAASGVGCGMRRQEGAFDEEKTECRTRTQLGKKGRKEPEELGQRQRRRRGGGGKGSRIR